MTPLFRCPWCVQVERGVMAPARMREHILVVHRDVLIEGLGLLESFDTRKPLDPPRNGLKGHRRHDLVSCHHPGCKTRSHPHTLNPGISGEGDSS